MVKAIAAEMDKASGTVSQSYLSQIESGSRPHLTNTTRLLLAKFFKVHPGYLVDDPEGYQAELLSDLRGLEDKLDLWLIGGAERFPGAIRSCRCALLALAKHDDSRRCAGCCWRVCWRPRSWRKDCWSCCGRSLLLVHPGPESPDPEHP